jgi:pyridoxine kinase
LPLADMATPNRYELGLLSEALAKDNADLVDMARRTGISEVLISSAFAGPGQVANMLVAAGAVFRAQHVSSATAPHGTGDLLAALYLAHRLDDASPSDALGRAVGSTHSMVERAEGATRLPLAEAQDVLVDPERAVPVEEIE